MASETDIANLALNILGETQITSIDDTESRDARAVKVVYAHERDKLLQRAQWSFAKKQATISKLATAPLYKWMGAYQLPSDLLRLIEIDEIDAWNPKEYFDIQGKQLFLYRAETSDIAADTADIEYIYRCVDTTNYTALFIDALATALAARLARKLTGSDTKGQELLQNLETVVLPLAMTQNSQMVYSGKNHPLRSIMAKSLLGRARLNGDASNVGYDYP